MKPTPSFNYNSTWNPFPDDVVIDKIPVKHRQQALKLMGNTMSGSNGIRVPMVFGGDYSLPNFVKLDGKRKFYSAPGVRYYRRRLFAQFRKNRMDENCSGGCSQQRTTKWMANHWAGVVMQESTSLVAFNLMKGSKPHPQLAHVIREAHFNKLFPGA